MEDECATLWRMNARLSNLLLLDFSFRFSLNVFQICTQIQTGGVIQEFDMEQMVPYYVKGKTWVGYDNKNSFTIKVFNVLLPIMF